MKTLTALFAATLLTAAVVQSAQAEESALRPLGSLIEKQQQTDRTLAENGADRSLQPSIQRQQDRLDRRALAENGTDRSLQPSIQRQQDRLDRRALAENGADRSLQPSIERQQNRLDGQRLAADGAERTLQQWPQRQPTHGSVA
ncbi:hypothetical protein [uncultured Pseudomonas sp.]|uniref:hypothetical protein n=1 Tax=uncultured Pseudomonas sp. TaxID=114707 RepID=UPI0025E0332E|nr:hypothetical protein [uncultured Pseudomonas sp.]